MTFRSKTDRRSKEEMRERRVCVPTKRDLNALEVLEAIEYRSSEGRLCACRVKCRLMLGQSVTVKQVKDIWRWLYRHKTRIHDKDFKAEVDSVIDGYKKLEEDA